MRLVTVEIYDGREMAFDADKFVAVAKARDEVRGAGEDGGSLLYLVGSGSAWELRESPQRVLEKLGAPAHTEEK